MSFKRCFKCLETLPLEAFYKHGQMPDGHLNKCKECTKKDVTANRLARIEYYRSYDKRRASLPHRVAARTEYTQRYRELFPKRTFANYSVNNAIRDGKLKRCPCFVCGEKAVAHHPDYDRPLDVVWLCQVHHKEAHALATETA
jgi:hypothetical protein